MSAAAADPTPGTTTRAFLLPDLGEGLTESEIVSWRVGVGDTVTLNQVIGEVETAKAVVELPSPYAGKVTALLVAPGDVVAVGAPIAEFEVAADAGRAPGGTSSPKREATLVGYGAMPETGGRPARRARRLSVVEPAAQEPQAPAAERGASAEPAVTTAASAEPEPMAPEETAPEPTRGAASERPRSTPPVRKLAKDLGVDLTSLTGTGAHGLITRDDVLASIGTQTPPSGAPATVPEGTPAAGAPTAEGAGRVVRETRSPIKGVRKHTAAAMVASAFTAPHASEFLTIDVTPAMDLIGRLKASRAFAGLKVTPLTLVAKALLIALTRNPTLNSHWDEDAQEIVQYHYVNLGIAAATPRGLMVPNLKDAERLSLAELAGALAELAQTAKDGRTAPADLSGGTISITNIGVFGIDAGTPILNPGEAAILAMGQVRRLPWEHEGEIALRQVMTLSLSFDHRLVDGEQASRFLADVGAVLADPGMVLTMV
ncbi:dihydrolipoamide acetyltransferase component of pyruvate dehydrogenase complex [Sinomonas cellulolyticus]|uniref:Dihydrolipoamide acetyltransferase component of pyruvate dehydrogenase complex n=1 Tax=Sinomonas cellulolyticus TaxID=2801916 RepID=A0ABS1K4R2_9MICC|nr:MULTISPECIES: dihydrolipoamide acetyltransferase family protein [Sinomonas]MBL0706669.1 2-oxo acid dehydrogenase subunit E2 [Sinomonas cellulolyticus]GHG56049.1 dihydrolipoamide acetyltransferase component of pyruvate dehydrogenase complex [Sinomonas sp. KCTC 49339]